MSQNKSTNLTKKNISNNLNTSFGTSKSKIDKITQDIIESFIEILLSENKINITNFGKFILKNKKKRVGRNPKTGKLHEISERKVVNFKVSQLLNKKINSL
tara:strand:- start:44 stop:346 length:303 start_codon:yes stop_codon:yes gene_type:complete